MNYALFTGSFSLLLNESSLLAAYVQWVTFEYRNVSVPSKKKKKQNSL